MNLCKVNIYDVNIYDVNGNLRPLKDIFKDLNNKPLNDIFDENKTNISNRLFYNIDAKSYITLLAKSITSKEVYK